jgi:hypothetical protein
MSSFRDKIMAVTFPPTAQAEIDAEKAGYDPLLRRDSGEVSESNSDLDTALPLHAMQRPHPHRRYVPILGKLLFIVTGVLCLLGLGRLSATHTPGHDHWVAPRQACWCGTNTAEAVALGCAYDQIAVAWLPPHCRDAELEHEFAHAGPNPDGSWNYFDEPDRRWRLNLTEVGSRADSHLGFFSSLEWHIAHCTYNWLKQFRAHEKGTTIESQVNTEGHVRHCYSIFRLRMDLEDIATISGVEINGDRPPPTGKKQVSLKDLKVVPALGGPPGVASPV